MIPVDRRAWLRLTGSAVAGLVLAGGLAGAPHPFHARSRSGEGDPGGFPGGSRGGTRGLSGAGASPGWAGFEDRLEDLLEGLLGRRGVECAVMGVVSGDGSFRWTGARGEARPGGPAMTPETPWFTASITKLFIAASVMRLAEDGALALDDRMVDHLPRELTRGLHVLDGVDRTDRITVEHLLAHASGLPDYIEDRPPRGSTSGDRRSLVQQLVEDGDRAWTLEDTARRVREELRPHFPPQDLRGDRVRIRYSDTGFQLLTGIVEAHTGEPFHRALEELVLEPLALDRTWVPGHPRPGIPSATPAVLRAGDDVVDFPRFFRAIGDLNSTADDLLHFMTELQQGRFFRDPETWPRLQRRWNRFPQALDRAALRQPGWPIEYGLGVMRFRLPRLLTPFRPVPAVVGHTGSTGSWLFHVPDLDLYLVGNVSQISAGPLPYRFVPRLLRAALDHRGG